MFNLGFDNPLIVGGCGYEPVIYALQTHDKAIQVNNQKIETADLANALRLRILI